MQRFLLDTSTILHIIGNSRTGVRAADALTDGEITTSVICYCEVLNKTDVGKLAKAEEFLSKMLVFPLSLSDGEVAKEFQLACRRSGKQVPTVDCLIAATAANNSAIVVAADSDFERIAGIEKIIL